MTQHLMIQAPVPQRPRKQQRLALLVLVAASLILLSGCSGAGAKLESRTASQPAQPTAAPVQAAAPPTVATFTPTPAPTFTPTSTPVPPTATPEPTHTPIPPSPTPTSPPPPATPEPTATATFTPETTPRAVASSQANVREGPGMLYAIVGQMAAGDRAEIVGRNADSGWWQIILADGTQGWVNVSLVTGSGPLDAVALAQNIPTLAPTPVPPPSATSTPKPQAGPAFRIVKARMLTRDENGGCMGNHNIFVKVVDAQGNPLNGVAVQRVWAKLEDGSPIEGYSGSKGSDYLGRPDEGWVGFDLFKHGDQVVIARDVDGSPTTSDVSQPFEVEDEKIGAELLLANGYCSPIEDCQRRIDENTICRFHYSWEVTFQRQY